MNGSQLRQLIYLLLSLSGLVLTGQANWHFAQQVGTFDLARFIADASSTYAAQSLSWDLVVGSTAVLIWMVAEAKRIGMRHAVWPILLSVSVAFACGAPLFLMLRERHLQKTAEGSASASG